MGLLDFFSLDKFYTVEPTKEVAETDDKGTPETEVSENAEGVISDRDKELMAKAVEEYRKVGKDPLLPVKGGQQSARSNTSLLDLIMKNTILESADYPYELLDTLYKLAIYNEDFSYAVDNIAQLGNTPYKIYFNDSLPKSLVKKCLEEISVAEPGWYKGGIPSLVNDLLCDAVVTGAISAEIVPRKDLRGILKTVTVAAPDIRIFYDRTKKDYIYAQKAYNAKNAASPGYINLNPITYKYYAYRKLKGNPYAIPPLLAALDAIKLDNDMICGLKNVMARLGIFGFLEVLVNPPRRTPGATDASYYAKCSEYLRNKVQPEVEKGFNKGYIIGFNKTHEFKMHSTTPQNMQGINHLVDLITTRKHAGLKQDPMMLGRNSTTTETLGRVLIAKLGNQVRNFQTLVANYLQDLIHLHLRLKGYPVEFVKVVFDAAMIGDEVKAQTAEGLKIDNLKKLYDAGIISQEQFAQEAGYEEAAEKEPREPKEAAPGKTKKVKDKSTTDVDNNTVEEAEIALGGHLPEFVYSQDCGSGCNHELSLGFRGGLEDLFKKYFAPVRKGWGKAVNELSLEIGRELAKMSDNAGTESITNRVLYILFTRFKSEFTDKQKGSINAWVTYLYNEFRRDKSIFKGYNKKKVPTALFDVNDRRTIDFYKRNDSLYLGKFITDPDLKKKITKFIKQGIEAGNLPVGTAGNTEAIERFRKQFATVLKGQEWKIERILRSTVSRMKNTGAIRFMSQAGVASFERVEVMDRLTCPYCRELNGKIFDVPKAIKKLDLVNQTEPGFIGAVDPFITARYKADELKDLSAEDIQKSGVSMALLHPNCRGTVVAVL